MEVAKVTDHAHDDEGGDDGTDEGAKETVVPQGVPSHLGSIQDGGDGGSVVLLRYL